MANKSKAAVELQFPGVDHRKAKEAKKIKRKRKK